MKYNTPPNAGKPFFEKICMRASPAELAANGNFFVERCLPARGIPLKSPHPIQFGGCKKLFLLPIGSSFDSKCRHEEK